MNKKFILDFLKNWAIMIAIITGVVVFIMAIDWFFSNASPAIGIGTLTILITGVFALLSTIVRSPRQVSPKKKEF